MIRLAVACTLTLGAMMLQAQTAAVATPVAPGASQTVQTEGGKIQQYSVDLGAGDFAGITIEQQGIDVVVDVYDSAFKKLIAEFDQESRDLGQERVGLAAGTATAFGLKIRTRYPRSSPGAYTIRCDALRPANDQDRALFHAHQLTEQALELKNDGKFEDALKLAQEAAAEAEKGVGPKDPFYADTLGLWALFLRSKADYAESVSVFERAISISQEALGREDPQVAQLMSEVGAVYLRQNDFAHAEPMIKGAMEITERTLGRNHPRVAGNLMDLASLYESREDLDRAVAELQRALDIAQQTMLPDDFQLIALTHNLGNLYSLQRDFARAKPLLEKSLTMIEQKFGRDHLYTTNPLQNLGTIARQEGQYDRALELYKRAKDVREKAYGAQNSQTATLWINIGNVYASRGDYDKAIESHLRALSVLEPALGHYHNLTVMALTNIARTYAAKGDVPKAIEFEARHDEALEKNIQMNLALGSEQEKLTYLRSADQRTERTLSMCLQLAPGNQAACDLATTVLLQRKGRVLDATSESLAALRQRLNESDREALDELAAANTKLATLSLNGPGKTPAAEFQKQLDELRKTREKLESVISSRSGEFRAQVSTVDMPSVQAEIPADAALIEFTVYHPFDFKRPNEDEASGPAHYAAYVLRRDGHAQWKDLGAAEEIDRSIAALREALRDPHSDVRARSRALYTKVFAPLRALTGDAARYLVSPDGELNLVPFEALVDGQGRYLVEQKSISYLTSGRDLLRLKTPRTNLSGPVVLANPQFGDANTASARTLRGARRSITSANDLRGVYFAPLSGTAEEARAIKSKFPEAKVLTGSEATKAALMKVQAPEILHIATHGFFLEEKQADVKKQEAAPLESPLVRSGLALAGANLSHTGNNNGILTALEASGLNLWGSKLVTLSACDTGVGEVKNGEGVYGLRRAFVLAGAETLVMTLWPVSDYVTREIMTEYYGGLQHGLARGEALRRAQLTLMHKTGRQHPFYWASYIQSGDWKGLDDK